MTVIYDPTFSNYKLKCNTFQSQNYSNNLNWLEIVILICHILHPKNHQKMPKVPKIHFSPLINYHSNKAKLVKVLLGIFKSKINFLKLHKSTLIWNLLHLVIIAKMVILLNLVMFEKIVIFAIFVNFVIFAISMNVVIFAILVNFVNFCDFSEFREFQDFWDLACFSVFSAKIQILMC